MFSKLASVYPLFIIVIIALEHLILYFWFWQIWILRIKGGSFGVSSSHIVFRRKFRIISQRTRSINTMIPRELWLLIFMLIIIPRLTALMILRSPRFRWDFLMIVTIFFLASLITLIQWLFHFLLILFFSVCDHFGYLLIFEILLIGYRSFFLLLS